MKSESELAESSSSRLSISLISSSVDSSTTSSVAVVEAAAAVLVDDDTGAAVMVVTVDGTESGTGAVVESGTVGVPEPVVVTMTSDASAKLVDEAVVVVATVVVDEAVTVVVAVTGVVDDAGVLDAPRTVGFATDVTTALGAVTTAKQKSYVSKRINKT